MVKYAREDTHYLLYMYDRIRMELLEQGSQRNPLNIKALMRAVYHKSTAICLQSYEKPQTKDYDYETIVRSSRLTHSVNQLRVLKMILKWRDYVSRLDDESPKYMLPNHILFAIAKEMPTSRNEMRDCRRASAEPPAIQKYQEQLLSMIAQKLSKKKEKSETSKLNIQFKDSQTKYTIKDDEDMEEESKKQTKKKTSSRVFGQPLKLDQTLKLPMISVSVKQSSQSWGSESESKVFHDDLLRQDIKG